MKSLLRGKKLILELTVEECRDLIQDMPQFSIDCSDIYSELYDCLDIVNGEEVCTK